eukprot:SAG11_NODE_1614_length_4579_cov_11.855357_1_plen_193_part_00
MSGTGDNANCTHARVLEFVLNGQPYVNCDMTSSSATIVVRQYQNAVFLPMMRTHGWVAHDPPRFPLMWGGTEHADAMRDALDLRYRFLPHLLSLSRKAWSDGVHIVRPAYFEFPEEQSRLEWTYMVGDSLLPVDIVHYDYQDVCLERCPRNTSLIGDPLENNTLVELPVGEMFFKLHGYTENRTVALRPQWS